jgi:hypothetical protein
MGVGDGWGGEGSSGGGVGGATGSCMGLHAATLATQIKMKTRINIFSRRGCRELRPSARMVGIRANDVPERQ